MQIWNPIRRKELKQHERVILMLSYSPTQSHIVYSQNVRLTNHCRTLSRLTEANAKIYDDLMYRHWNSGADTFSHLFVAPYPSLENPVDLLKGEKFQAPLPPFGGMEQVAWSPDGEKLAYCCKQSFGKTFAESTNSDIFIYDLKTGNTTNISSFNLGYDLDPVFSPNGNYIAWLSMEKPGFESDKKRIIIHDFNSETTVDYSTTFDYSAENLVWNDKSNTLYFLSTIAATNQIFELNLDLKRIKLLTQGDHDYNSLLFAKDRLITTKTTTLSLLNLLHLFARHKETRLTFKSTYS